MDVLTAIFLSVVVMLVHELGHLVATEYYGVTESLSLVRKKDGVGKYYFWGMAVKYDADGLSGRQRFLIASAPLLWVPASFVVAAFGLPWLAAILFVAGVMTVLSDYVMHVFDVGDASSFHEYPLVSF